MGEELVSSCLRSKFMSILEEAKADPASQSLIISRFQSIADRMWPESWFPVDHLYQLIEALSDFRVFTYRSRTPRKGIKLHHRVSDWIFKRRMTKLLDAMEKKTPPTDGRRPSPELPVREYTYPIRTPSSIIGFDAEAETIEEWLMSSNNQQVDALPLRVIGIVGRCGCGKTALAHKVFLSPTVMEEFSPRIWVFSILREYDIVRVVDSILCQAEPQTDPIMQKDLDSTDSMVEMLENLRRHLMGKRYLIVLDDARQADPFFADLGRDYKNAESLSRGLPNGTGGAVIVTSRREDVIGHMVGDKHVIRLGSGLSDDICWQIFSTTVQEQNSHKMIKEKLSKIEDDAKTMFDGLPLVAKALADVLREPLIRKLPPPPPPKEKGALPKFGDRINGSVACEEAKCGLRIS